MPSAEVWLEQTSYFPGASIAVNFKTPGALGDSAWIGVVASDIPHGSSRENDRHDVSYVYVRGRAEGTATVSGPRQPGSWDVRLHDSTDSDGNEIAFASFEVVLPTGNLELGQTAYKPGETVMVRFTVSEGLPTNVVQLKALIADHQGLLIASPEYNSSISPLLKNAIDWASRSGGAPDIAPYQHKVAALVSAS